MDLKVLVNVILIILVLHLILKNIDFDKTFYVGGTKVKESFKLNEPCNIKDYANEHKKTMEYLLDIPPPSTVNNDTNCYKELVDYVDKCDTKTDNVKAGNYYVEDDNSANFMSNVLNINKFYDINNKVPGNYDGLDGSQLDKKDIHEKYSPQFLNKIEDQTCFPKRNLEPSEKDNTIPVKPDNWNYRNELPMNGGSVVGSVVGYDSLNSGFTMFDQNEKLINTRCSVGENCSREPDDIRFGLGYPNKEYKEIR